MTAARTYDDIYEDICATTLPDAEPGTPGFLAAYAAYHERKRELWGELANLAARDASVPGWARLAAVLLRDQHARDAADCRRDAQRRAAQQEESTRGGTSDE